MWPYCPNQMVLNSKSRGHALHNLGSGFHDSIPIHSVYLTPAVYKVNNIF